MIRLLVASPMACFLLIGCADKGADRVHLALCDEMASTRSTLHLIANQHGAGLAGDIEAVAAAKARTLAGDGADRATRSDVCYSAVRDLYAKVNVEIVRLEFGAELVAKAKQDWNNERNPLAGGKARSAFERASLAANVDCGAGDLKGALVRMSEGLRDYDGVLLRAFDACEVVGWDRSGWEQTEPGYHIP